MGKGVLNSYATQVIVAPAPERTARGRQNNPGHPFGVRGVGEVPIVPPPAAMANAIFRATGVRMRSLPMSPPKVLHELLSSDG